MFARLTLNKLSAHIAGCSDDDARDFTFVDSFTTRLLCVQTTERVSFTLTSFVVFCHQARAKNPICLELLSNSSSSWGNVMKSWMEFCFAKFTLLNKFQQSLPCTVAGLVCAFKLIWSLTDWAYFCVILCVHNSSMRWNSWWAPAFTQHSKKYIYIFHSTPGNKNRRPPWAETSLRHTQHTVLHEQSSWQCLCPWNVERMNEGNPWIGKRLFFDMIRRVRVSEALIHHKNQ